MKLAEEQDDEAEYLHDPDLKAQDKEVLRDENSCLNRYFSKRKTAYIGTLIINMVITTSQQLFMHNTHAFERDIEPDQLE